MLAAHAPILLPQFGAGTPAGRLLGNEPKGLALDFVNRSALIRGSGFNRKGTPDGILTCTRSGTAYCTGPTGLLTSVAANTLRYEYDPITLACRGLLVEEQRTNLVYQSSDPTSAEWAVGAASKTTGQTDIFGATSAALITADGANAQHYLIMSSTNNVSYTSGSTYVISRYVKAGTQSLIQLTGPSAAFGTGQYANFNLSAGTVTVSTGLASAGATISAGPNGYWLISIAVTATATTTTNGGLLAFIASGTSTRLPSNTIATTFYTCAPQVEVGAFRTSYIPTTSAQVTRNADQVSIATSLLPFSATAGTMVPKFSSLSSTDDFVVASIDDGGTNNRFMTYVSSGTVPRGFIASGGVTQANINVGTYTSPNVAKIGMAWQANDAQAAFNGATGTQDTSVSLPTVTNLQLGRTGSSNTQLLNGIMKEFVYIPRRLSDAELLARTA